VTGTDAVTAIASEVYESQVVRTERLHCERDATSRSRGFAHLGAAPTRHVSSRRNAA
jgi:hypothetical protein